jgi:toxin ParE1/3/4
MHASIVEFHEEAGVEYDKAFDWYLQRSPEVAIRFSDEVKRAIAEISVAPERWAAFSSQTRSFLLRRFPYRLIYRERPEGIVQVLAVAHTSRRPRYWERRL